jgi:heme exporter protein D
VQEFLDMGGYAGFIWPSYIITALVLAIVFALTWRLLKTSERRLEALQAARGRRPRGKRGAAPSAPQTEKAPASAAGESR